ncbi:MAG: hypothetical protein GY851_18055 [bacterium]|nr:hypothetical protein [bacterium]
MRTYTEHQGFAAWVYALLVPTLGGAAWAATVSGTLAMTVLAFTVGIAVFVLNLLHLTVRVNDGTLHAQLGWVVPCFWKRIPLDDLRTVRVVDYRPILDAGGWGMRFGRFEGQSCTFWNARGNRGVLIETAAGKRYIIGSQNPEALKEAIEGEAADG